MKIRFTVDIPALDNLVDYLKSQDKAQEEVDKLVRRLETSTTKLANALPKQKKEK